ncbi:MAG: hypothetical protein NVS9B15_26330 [Acidobacteriaceae bacterium]
MLLLTTLVLAVVFVFTALPIALALALTAFGGILGCAGLAYSCPRKLKDDCLFTADVI